MLYDPKWEKKTETKKPDLYSLADFIAWLETHDPAEEYDYMNCKGACLMGQWLAQCGFAWDHDLWAADRLWPIRKHSTGKGKTFGDALRRARAAVR